MATTFNGKTYEAMTSAEREELYNHDQILFGAMREEAFGKQRSPGTASKSTTPSASRPAAAATHRTDERSTFNAKTYEQMTSAERQLLANHDEALFTAMRDDAHSRGLI